MDLLASSADLRDAPYPHLVLRDELPTELMAWPFEEFSGRATTTDGQADNSSERLTYAGHKALADPEISATWKQLVEAQPAREFPGQCYQRDQSHRNRGRYHLAMGRKHLARGTRGWCPY